MGLREYLGEIDFWRTGSEAQMPIDTTQRAQSSVYMSDYLEFLKKKGVDVSNPAVVRAARVSLDDSIRKKNKRAREAGVAESKAAFAVLGPSISSPTAGASFNHLKNILTGGADSPAVLPEAAIVDDVTAGEIGDKGRSLKRIATGEDRVEPTSPALRTLSKGISGLTSGRVALPAETGGEEISEIESIVGDISELAGAGIQILVVGKFLGLKGAGIGAGPLAIGLHGAARPEADTVFKRTEALLEGTALGMGIQGSQTAERGLMRNWMGKQTTARRAYEKYLASNLGETVASGQVGAGLSAFESLKNGEVPTASDLIEGFVGFAASHALIAGGQRLSPNGVALAEGGRRARQFLDSDSAQARQIRELRDTGEWQDYNAAVHGKILQFAKQVRGERIGREVEVVDPIERMIAGEASALERIGRRGREEVLDRVVAEHEQAMNEIKAEEIEKAYLRDELDRGPARPEPMAEPKSAGLEHTPPEEFTARAAVDFLVKEVSMTGPEARRVVKDMKASGILRNGKFNEDDVRMAGQAYSNNRAQAAAEANKKNISLRSYKTPAAVRGAVTKHKNATGDTREYSIIQDADGTWFAAPARESINATKELPVESPDRPQPSRSIDEKLALGRIGRRGRAMADEPTPERVGTEEAVAVEEVRPSVGDRIATGIERLRAAKEAKRGRTEQDIADEAGMAKEDAEAEALRASMPTMDEVRARRVEEAKAKGDAVRLAGAEVPRRPNVLSDQDIVNIAREPGGIEKLKEGGYERADIVRAVGEVKRQQIIEKTNVSNDVILGFGFGGGQGQYLEALGLASSGLNSGARGLVRGGLYVANGITESMNRIMTPYDYAAEAVNRVAAKYALHPMETRINEVGKALGQQLFDRVPGYGKAIHALREIAGIRFMSDDEMKKVLRAVVGEKAVISKDADLRKMVLDRAESGALEAVNGQRKEAGLRPMGADEFSALMYGVVQYGRRAPDGSRPGVRAIDEAVREAEELHGPISKEERAYVEQVKDAINRLDEMPSEVQAFVSEVHNSFQSLWDQGVKSGYFGENYIVGKAGSKRPWKRQAAAQKRADAINAVTPDAKAKVVQHGDGYAVEAKSGALKPGMSYLPEWGQQKIKGKEGSIIGRFTNRPRSASPFATRGPESHAKSVKGGLFERMLVHGQSPKTFSLGEWYQQGAVSTLGAIENNALAKNLLGQVFTDKRTGERLPAAITESQLNKLRKGGAKEWAALKDFVGVDEIAGPVEMEGIPGFNIKGDRLLLHPEVATAVRNISEKPMSNFAVKLNSTLKRINLSFSPFHAWALALNTMAYGENPIKAFRDWENLLNDPRVNEYLRHGLTLNENDVRLANNGYEKVFGSPQQGRNAVLNAPGKAMKWMDHQLWDKMYRATKIVSMHSAVRQLESMGLSREEAVRQGASQINKLHGGINLHWEGISSKSKQIASFLMLAPDWTISNSSWSVQTLVGQGPSGAVARTALVRHALGLYTFGNVLNIMLSGHPMWENDEGHKHHIQMEIGGETNYIDVSGHAGEFYRVLLGAVNSVLPEDREILQSYDRNPIDWLRGKQSPILRGGMMAATGQSDYPPGYALPGISDIMDHRTKGKFGARSRNVDALFIGAIRTGSPIFLKNTAEAMIEADDPIDVFTDHRFLSGVIGRHVLDERKTKQKSFGSGRSGGRSGGRTGGRSGGRR